LLTRSNSQLLKFLAVGAAVLALENAIVYLLTLAGVPYVFTRLLATASALAVSYVLNSVWTFPTPLAMQTFIHYAAGVSLALLVSYLVSLLAFYVALQGQHELLATNIGAAVAALVNFVFQKRVTFADKRGARSRLQV
jgi:putative flippase GtrA